MIDLAAYNTTSGSLIAITHSSYLRLLLGAVQDFYLFSASSSQSNCGINVIDFPHPSQHITTTSQHITTTTTTALTATAMNSFGEGNILVPKADVIRMNERRHLSLIVKHLN
jgi:hypothetical protein